MVFSEALVVHLGFDLKLSYLIMLIDLPVLLWYWDVKAPKAYLLFLTYLLTLGLIPVLYTENTVALFIAQFAGIAISSFFAVLFFKEQDRPVEDVFRLYAEAAFWVCAWGLFQSLATSLYLGQFAPVRSILLEPAHFCQIVIPGFYYYWCHAAESRSNKRRTLLMLCAILLSFSSTGFLALLIAILLKMKGKRLAVFLLPPTLILVGVAAYFASPGLQLRVNDSAKGLMSANVSGVNLSTYALLSNLYVAQSTLTQHPYLGVGLGGFFTQHEKYIATLPGVEEFLDLPEVNLNAHDANSLLLRVATDFGLVGVVVLFAVLIYFRPVSTGELASVGQACLLYLFIKLFREGHYFSPEMYFFLGSYVLSSRVRNLQRPRTRWFSLLVADHAMDGASDSYPRLCLADNAAQASERRLP
jgi:hypothetical protein